MALYAWITDEGVLATTEYPEYIPEKYKTTVTYFPELSFKDVEKLKISEGKILLKSEDEQIQELREKLLSELKQYTYNELQKTDWTVIKSLELKADIKTLYPDIAEQRTSIRQANNEMVQRIQRMTLDELINCNITLEMNKLWRKL